MTGMDRRSLIKGVVTTSAVLAIHPLAWAAEQRPGVFVADARFAASAAAALERRKLGVTVIDPREEDLGIAWRRRIPELLEQNGLPMEGVTLWSDLMISQTFARRHGLRLVQSSREMVSDPAAGLHHWKLA